MIVKKIRKGITLACCFCLMATRAAPMTIQAKVPEQAQPLMAFITSYSTDLAISGNGTASVTAYVIAKSNATNTYVKATLQKKTGSNWIRQLFHSHPKKELYLDLIYYPGSKQKNWQII